MKFLSLEEAVLDRMDKLNPNYNRQEMVERILKLKREGHQFQDIAEILNNEGFKSSKNLPFRAALVQSIVANELRRERKAEGRASRSGQSSGMLTFPEAEEAPKKSGKIVALMGDIEDVTEALKGWLK